VRFALFLKRLADVSSSPPVRMAFHQARIASITPAPSADPPVVLLSFMPAGAIICGQQRERAASERARESKEERARKRGRARESE
jgi:hypothetical protein